MRHQYSRVSESKQTYSTSSIDKNTFQFQMSSSASKMLIVCFLVKDFKQQWLKIIIYLALLQGGQVSSFLCC